MFKYNYKIGQYVNKKNADGQKLYFAGIDHMKWNGIPCAILTTDKDNISDTNKWMRWKPDDIIEMA